FMLCACTDMYLKTAEVWLRTSRLGQRVFRIYSVAQLLLFCDLRDFYLLQSPLSLRYPASPLSTLRHVPVSLSRILSAAYLAQASIADIFFPSIYEYSKLRPLAPRSGDRISRG